MRKARDKSKKYKYHIRVRGLDEILLFRDDQDKDKYLSLFKKYKKQYKYKIYSFCCMDTHAHFFIDPYGEDISVIMHKINLCYAQYYNKRYNRGGPVFRGRFESDPVYSETYSLALSAYIHNNPKDVFGYRGQEEYFYYSSYGIYAGFHNDKWGILDINYILGLMHCKERSDAIDKYIRLVKKQNIENSMRNIIECLQNGEFYISKNLK